MIFLRLRSFCDLCCPVSPQHLDEVPDSANRRKNMRWNLWVSNGKPIPGNSTSSVAPAHNSSIRTTHCSSSESRRGLSQKRTCCYPKTRNRAERQEQQTYVTEHCSPGGPFHGTCAMHHMEEINNLIRRQS